MKNTNRTFKLKRVTGKILTYKIGKNPFRKYDSKMDDAFAIAFLTHGTEEEIEARKELFETLPDMETTEDENAFESKLDKMTKAQLIAYAKEHKLTIDEKAFNKTIIEDIIKQMKAKEEAEGDAPQA